MLHCNELCCLILVSVDGLKQKSSVKTDRHRYLIFPLLNVSPGVDLNHEELLEDVPFLQSPSNSNYVPDAVVPPGEPWLHGGPSRAVLSLPSCLCLCGDSGFVISDSGSSGEEHGEKKVFAKCQLQQGVLFGPFVGEVCKGHMPNNLKYAWAVSRYI